MPRGAFCFTLSGVTAALDDVRRLRREIIRSLWLRGRPPLEGSTSAEELLFLAASARRAGARLIGEIGFNAGFSTQVFLSACPDSRVVSFDLVEHGYTKVAKRIVDRKFPGRHTLVPGDSTATVPRFVRSNPDMRFDLVFIDGGHAYDVAKADIANMRPLCTGATAVIIDDLTPWRRWGKGPARAWREAIEAGLVRQEQVFKDGVQVVSVEPPGKRVWALGRYLYPGG